MSMSHQQALRSLHEKGLNDERYVLQAEIVRLIIERDNAQDDAADAKRRLAKSDMIRATLENRIESLGCPAADDYATIHASLPPR